MGTITLRQAARWCGGRVEEKYADVTFCGASNDTRTLQPGQLFVALKALRDGHDFVNAAFEKGADGVILCGCHPGDCHYSTGNYYARRRMTLLFSMLDYLGIEKERTRVEWVSAAEGAKFAATMNEFAAECSKQSTNATYLDMGEYGFGYVRTNHLIRPLHIWGFFARDKQTNWIYID